MLSETDQENVRLAFENINYSSLNTNFHKLQSTCNTHCSATLNPLQFLLKTQPHYANKTENLEEIRTIDNIRSYVHNSLSSFISRCFDKRYAFLKELTKNASATAAT